MKLKYGSNCEGIVYNVKSDRVIAAIWITVMDWTLTDNLELCARP